MRSSHFLIGVASSVLVAACSQADTDGETPGAGVPEEPKQTCAEPATTPTWTLADRFCRGVNEVGVTLVDWEGQIANPAITMTLLPPRAATFPVDITVTADTPRIYFDAGSRPTRKFGTTYDPPSFTHTFADATPFTFKIAAWPDRDGTNDEHTLRIAGSDGLTTNVPIHVLDQDVGTTPSFAITLDFSKDPALPDGTRFFDDPAKRQIMTQAAEDWAYFLDGSGLDPVAAGAEETLVDDVKGWYGERPKVTNATGYTGFLLYGVGIQTEEIRSTGFPNPAGPIQTRGGTEIPGRLRRSGAIEMESRGNYATVGWTVSTSDDDWYKLENLTDLPADIASIAHHEIGHALFFDRGYTRFKPGEKDEDTGKITYGTLSSAALREYYPGDPAFPGDPRQVDGLRIDHNSHFSTGIREGSEPQLGTIDPASGFGAFGNEYADTGTMPRRRWLITKLDLLAAEAIGYSLRRTASPFVALAVTPPELAPGAAKTAYSGRIEAKGGVPPYNFTVATGELPAGVRLDWFTGALAGTPRAAGTYTFDVKVEDSLGAVTSVEGVALVVR